MAAPPPFNVPRLTSPPPSIVFEPTSDGDDSDFHFDLDHSSPGEPFNPHAAALLRRSPSPVLVSPQPQLSSSLPLQSPSSSLFPAPSLLPGSSPSTPPPARSPTVATHLLHPESRFYARSNSSSSYLRPPSSSGGNMADSETMTESGPTPSQQIPSSSSNNQQPPPNPFNFQTQYISTSPVKSNNIGLRRGHRYKHSSISAQHQIFQEPPPRPPPVLPASLPVPTLREAWASMQRDQRLRLFWCLCHAAVAVLVFLRAGSGDESLALTALSHLVFFDVGSAGVCVAVDVLGNFEVWRRSTIRHPFGLRRAEVLAGFAMSIFLVFGGFDLLSHVLKDVLEAVVSHSSNSSHSHNHGGHGHSHEGASTGGGPVSFRHIGLNFQTLGTVDKAALAAFVSTLISAYGLGNHARIRRALLLLQGVVPAGSSAVLPSVLSSVTATLQRLPLPAVLANPFHFLTLGVSLILLLLPLLFVAVPPWLDRLLCATIAVSMLLLGARLAVAQGLMLLMSYGGTTTDNSSHSDASVSTVLDELAAEPQVARIEDAQFWQVHYGLCMANLRLRVVRGCDDGALRQLRARVARLIQNRLGEGYGRGNSLRWEVTVQTSVDGV